jgi:hypothetical protein
VPGRGQSARVRSSTLCRTTLRAVSRTFWSLVYDEHQWAQERSGAHKQLSLFAEADTVRTKLFQEFDLVARQLDQGLLQNPFVTLRSGELHLKRPDALEVPERVRRLRQTIETRLPRIRIEDLLREVDKRCGFTHAFPPLPGYESRLEGSGANFIKCMFFI